MILLFYILLWIGISSKVTFSLTRKEKAQHFYEKAYSYLQRNEIDYALSSFRTTVRLENSSYLYWNDLGVTEMRKGQLKKAYQRFLRAYALEPNYEITFKNLQEIENHLSLDLNNDHDHHLNPHDAHQKKIASEKRRKEILQSGSFSPHQRYPRNQRHTIKPIPTYTREQFQQILDNLLLQTKQQLQSFLTKPFLVKQYHPMTDSHHSDYLAFSSLTEKYGNVKVDFYPHNMIEKQTHPFYQSLMNALQQLIEPSEIYLNVDISLPGSYLQWNLRPDHYQQILQDLQIQLPFLFDDEYLLQSHPRCFQQFTNTSNHNNTDLLTQYYLNTHWKMMLIGEEGAGMFNHQDTLLSPTWQLLLSGVKQWHLCANHFTPFLYQPGEVNLFAPNYDNYPNILKIKCYQFNQTNGDLLYYPGNYWHQTMSFETPTIGMTGTFIIEDSVKELIRELKKECEGANRLFPADPVFCSQLESCYQAWEDEFFRSKIVCQNDL